MKILINGKRNKEAERDYEGKYTSFKRKIRKLFKNVMWAGVIASIGYGVFLAGGFFQPRAFAVPVLHDNLTPKVEELKDKVVGDIRDCERASYTENDGLIVFDSNKVASIGTLQFQVKTVQYYYKKLYGTTITGKEALLIALDDQKAKSLAKDIIFKDSKGYANWYNCSKKINAQGRLEVIKELQK